MAPFETTGVQDDAEGPIGIATLHTRLRNLILDGVYPPGTLIPQEDLARTLGVSRTPLREVLRLLQKEGLVEAGRYQRSRIAPFNPETLDMLYAGRIQLETLGIALTIPHLQQADVDELASALAEMRTASSPDAWEKPHRRFHQILIAQVGQQVHTTIDSYADQSERYRRLFVQTEIHAKSVSMVEHGLIVAACQERNRDEAVRLLARHLARTALTVLAHMKPEYEPVAVRTALTLVQAGTPPTEDPIGTRKRTKPDNKSLSARSSPRVNNTDL